MVRLLFWILVMLAGAGASFAAVDCEDYAKKAAASGDGRTIFAAAMYLERLYDAVPAQDCERQAAPLLLQAVKMEVPGAMFQLGRVLVQREEYHERSFTTGLDVWEVAAKLGDSNAMTMLAATNEMTLRREVKDEFVRRAWRLYMEAVNKHNPVAEARTRVIEAKVAEAARKYELSAPQIEDLAVAYLAEEYTKEGRSARQTYRQTDEAIQAGMGAFAGRKLRWTRRPYDVRKCGDARLLLSFSFWGPMGVDALCDVRGWGREP